MAKLKFRDLTKKPKPKDINLLTGKAINKTKKKPSLKDTYKKEDQYIQIPSTIIEESLKINTLDHLHPDIQKLIGNSSINKMKSNGSESIYSLSNGLEIRISSISIGSKKKTKILIKDKKQTIINTQI